MLTTLFKCEKGLDILEWSSSNAYIVLTVWAFQWFNQVTQNRNDHVCDEFGWKQNLSLLEIVKYVENKAYFMAKIGWCMFLQWYKKDFYLSKSVNCQSVKEDKMI